MLLDHRLGFLAILASLFISGQTKKEDSSYENCALLSDLENVRFSWTLDDDAISVSPTPNFKVEVQGTVGDVGWLGIGFSSDGTMNSGGTGSGSDIVMGFSDSGRFAINSQMNVRWVASTITTHRAWRCRCLTRHKA